MTNFQLARMVETQYDEWLSYPHGWPNSYEFKKASTQRWIVREIVKNLRNYGYLPTNYILDNLIMKIKYCARVNPMFEEALRTATDVQNYILTMKEGMEDVNS